MGEDSAFEVGVERHDKVDDGDGKAEALQDLAEGGVLDVVVGAFEVDEDSV